MTPVETMRGKRVAVFGLAGSGLATARALLAGKNSDGDHRNFSVARPASASTTATIQKRMTICGSVQPSCSK